MMVMIHVLKAKYRGSRSLCRKIKSSDWVLSDVLQAIVRLTMFYRTDEVLPSSVALEPIAPFVSANYVDGEIFIVGHPNQ